MRYEGDDINRNNKWKSICRAALLNDSAPDTELSDTGSSSLGNSNFDFYNAQRFKCNENFN